MNGIQGAASDLTDQEQDLIAPFLPLPKTTGRPRSTAMREVMDAILYTASTGCAWRMLPIDFPALSENAGAMKGIDQLSASSDEHLAGSKQHGAGLLFLRFHGNKAHRRA